MKKLELVQACKNLVALIGLQNVETFYARYYGGAYADSTIMRWKKSDIQSHFNELSSIWNLELIRMDEEVGLMQETDFPFGTEEEKYLGEYTVEFVDFSEMTVNAYSREEAEKIANEKSGKSVFYVYFIRKAPKVEASELLDIDYAKHEGFLKEIGVIA